MKHVTRALALGLMLTLGLATPALAQDYDYGAGWLNGQGETGGQSTWDTQKPDYVEYNWVAHVMWVETTETSGKAWIELGYTRGWQKYDGTWMDYWGYYWAQQYKAGVNYYYEDHRLPDVPAPTTGSNHVYQTWYPSANTWKMKIDDTEVGSPLPQPKGGDGVMVGGETTITNDRLTGVIPETNSWAYKYRTGIPAEWRDWWKGTVFDGSDLPLKYHWEPYPVSGYVYSRND